MFFFLFFFLSNDNSKGIFKNLLHKLECFFWGKAFFSLQFFECNQRLTRLYRLHITLPLSMHFNVIENHVTPDTNSQTIALASSKGHGTETAALV